MTQTPALAEVLLDAGASTHDGQSLYHAVEWFDLAPLTLLARYGLDPDEVSYTIKHALDMRHDGMVLWFLDQGADPNATHPAARETSLHWAVKRAASPDVIRALLARGADPNARTKRGRTAYLRILGRTPLDLALTLGDLEAAELMREHGGVPTPRKPAGEFLAACSRADGGAARDLLRAKPKLLRRLSSEDAALIAHVAQAGRVPAVKLMLELGFDPSARGWMGLTALHWAGLNGDVELARVLVDGGAPQLDLGPDFHTPLHCAVVHQWRPGGDFRGVVEILLAGGAEVPPGLHPCGQADVDALLAHHAPPDTKG